MRNEEFLLRVERRMVMERFEPTREHFLHWLKNANALAQERRAVLQELSDDQGKTLDDLWRALTEDELFEWYFYIDCEIDANEPFP